MSFAEGSRPCPHCGGHAQFYNIGECEYSNDWTGKIGCCAEIETTIPYMQHRHHKDRGIKDDIVKKELLKEWNTRHEDVHIVITVDAT